MVNVRPEFEIRLEPNRVLSSQKLSFPPITLPGPSRAPTPPRTATRTQYDKRYRSAFARRPPRSGVRFPSLVDDDPSTALRLIHPARGPAHRDVHYRHNRAIWKPSPPIASESVQTGITDSPDIQPSPPLAGPIPPDRRRRLPQPVESSSHLWRNDDTDRDGSMRRAIDGIRKRLSVRPRGSPFRSLRGRTTGRRRTTPYRLEPSHDCSRSVSCAGPNWPRQERLSPGESFPLATEPNR